jgi:plasmid stabilization system protein ParE
MVKGRPKVVIDNVAKLQLNEAYKYIRKDSLQNADKVRAKILESIKALVEHPHKNPVDKYRSDNDGSYRAFEIYKYRISYYVSPEQIRVVRIRHTKMTPLQY